MPRLPSSAAAPASERQVSRGSLAAFEASAERPVRLHLLITLVLGLLVIAAPLYLWRRPRALPDDLLGEGMRSSIEAAPIATAQIPPHDVGSLTVAEAKTLACGDAANKRAANAPPCDRLVELEKAVATAISESATCVPREAGGGTIAYVVDVSFKKKTLALTTPKEGRSLKDAKVTAACQATVKAKLGGVTLEGMAHQHTRYRVSVIASYPGPVKL